MLPWQFRRSMHVSWLVAVVCLGVCVGIFMANTGRVSLQATTWLVLALLLSGFGLLKGKVYALPLVFVAGGIVGVWRGALYQSDLSPYSALIGETVTIQGKVIEDPDRGGRGELTLRLDSLVVDEYPIEGRLWMSTADRADIKRSDIVVVRGKVSEGFGSFAASMFRGEIRKVQRPVPGDVALTVRDWFADGVRRAIPEPEASLGVGYLVGQRRALPEELDVALKATGLTHIVVASGYNLTILVGAARRVFMKVSKFMATFVSGSLVLSFVAVTGMSPSMSRAGLVTGLALIAWYYGRRFHPLVILPFAAAITLLINPSYGQDDLGWQLSFASFAGVLVVAPLFQSYFFGPSEPRIIRQVFFETISAWLCTVPLIVLAFGQFSNVAILANMLVLPLVPLAMVLTFIAGSVAVLFPGATIIAGFPALLVLGYMTKTTEYLGNLPWAQTSLSMGAYSLVIYYALLLIVCWYTWRKTGFHFVQSTALR